MKVIFEYKQIRPGSKTGIPLVTNAIIDFLLEKKVFCHLLTNDSIKSRKDLDLREKNSPFLTLETTNYNYQAVGIYRFLFENFNLFRILNKFPQDIIFFPDSHGIPLLTKSNKCILLVHDLIPLSGIDKTSLFEKFIYWISMFISLHKAKNIISVSEFTKEEIIDKFNIPSSKITVIYNGLLHSHKFENLPSNDLQNLYKRLSLNNKDQFLFCGSGLAPRKNLLLTIQAFTKFISDQRNSNYKLVVLSKIPIKNNELVVNKEYSKIEFFIKNNNIQNKIIFTGNLSDIEKYNLMKKSKCVLFLSSSEGFGLPIIEAFYSCSPVICSDIKLFKEIGKNAVIYADINHINNIVNNMNKLIDNPTLISNLIQKGQQLIIKSYNYNQNLFQLIKMLQDINEK